MRSKEVWDFKKTPWFGDYSGEAVNKALDETSAHKSSLFFLLRRICRIVYNGRNGV